MMVSGRWLGFCLAADLFVREVLGFVREVLGNLLESSNDRTLNKDTIAYQALESNNRMFLGSCLENLSMGLNRAILVTSIAMYEGTGLIPAAVSKDRSF